MINAAGNIQEFFSPLLSFRWPTLQTSTSSSAALLFKKKKTQSKPVRTTVSPNLKTHTLNRTQGRETMRRRCLRGKKSEMISNTERGYFSQYTHPHMHTHRHTNNQGNGCWWRLEWELPVGPKRIRNHLIEITDRCVWKCPCVGVHVCVRVHKCAFEQLNKRRRTSYRRR